MLKIICRTEKYDLIHCHTPVGGVLGRLCGHIYPNTKVIYTAHGFHFYKGAPFIDWLFYYPVEKYLAKKTDCIVTINQEDYELAKKKFKTDIRYISGVGVNLKRFIPVSSLKEKNEIRAKYGFNKSDFVLIYCAQFIKRKNHSFMLDIVANLKYKIPNLKIVLVGSGNLENTVKRLSRRKNIDKYIRFMGYRNDVEKLYQLSDVLISTSKQEGFGINIVEGMATGLPVVCSDIRGHSEIVNINGSCNGYRLPLSDKTKFVEKIELLYNNKSLYEKISKNNVQDAKKFDINHSVSQMAQIYKEVMEL